MSADVTAVVLVGGRSTRMGRDKATLVPPDGDPRMLVQRVLDTLAPLSSAALLAGRGIEGLDVPAVVDRNVDAGPLAGIAAALHEVRTGLAVVAACDMPSIVPALVEHMLATARDAGSDTLCVLCASDRGPEPLLSVWRPEAAAHLDRALDAGTRTLRDAVASLPHLQIPPQQWRQHDPRGASFANWNVPEDLPHR